MILVVIIELWLKERKQTGWRKQFVKPNGSLGWLIGQLMSVKNKQRSLWVIYLLNLQSKDRILEIGFGSGIDILRVSASAEFVAGIDYSETTLNQASNRNANAIRKGKVELQYSQASLIPYKENSFSFCSLCPRHETSVRGDGETRGQGDKIKLLTCEKNNMRFIK